MREVEPTFEGSARPNGDQVLTPSYGDAADTVESKEGGADIIATGRESRRLRLLFLGPLFFAILAVIVVVVAGLFFHERRDTERGFIQLHTSISSLYKGGVEQDARALRAVMDVLTHDELLQTALARADRSALLDRTAPIFEEMKRDYNITHLYFTGPDRVNLLRVHQPNRHGDSIDRITTMMAERSGDITYGVELGPLGTFTLRLVSPWYDKATNRLLGYVEIGMEIDRVLDDIRKFFNVEMLVIIKKQFLDRRGWQDGMRTFGRAPEWDRYPNVVVNSQTLRDIPSTLAERLAHDDFRHSTARLVTPFGRAAYRTLSVPLIDAAGRDVGDVVVLADVSAELDAAKFIILLTAIASALVGSALLFLFYWLAGWIGRRIENDENALRHAASHDSLSGLFNHRTCYFVLEREIARAKRYGRPLCLLMLDIDHFKRVNDVYGHLAGDRTIRELGQLLQRMMRRTDSACRYGGEEICAVLSETECETAVEIAERIRTAIERMTVATNDGKNFKVTVSIGVAAFPQHAGSIQDLINAADAAMYAAKSAGRNCVRQCGEIDGATAPALSPAQAQDSLAAAKADW